MSGWCSFRPRGQRRVDVNNHLLRPSPTRQAATNGGSASLTWPACTLATGTLGALRFQCARSLVQQKHARVSLKGTREHRYPLLFVRRHPDTTPIRGHARVAVEYEWCVNELGGSQGQGPDPQMAASRDLGRRRLGPPPRWRRTRCYPRSSSRASIPCPARLWRGGLTPQQPHVELRQRHAVDRIWPRDGS